MIKIIDIDPYNKATDNFRKAIVEYEAGNKLNAESLFKKSIETNPTLIEAWINVGVLLFERDDKMQAKEYFEKALKIEPQHSGVLRYLGATLMDYDFQQAELYLGYISIIRR